MPRPKLPRCISGKPRIRGFKPHGTENNGEVILSLEEFEVFRLIDYQGLDQAGVAEIMGVSRQTVGRILKQSRFKVAQSLVMARQLTVQGGCYEIVRKQRMQQGSGCRRCCVRKGGILEKMDIEEGKALCQD